MAPKRSSKGGRGSGRQPGLNANRLPHHDDRAQRGPARPAVRSCHSARSSLHMRRRAVSLALTRARAPPPSRAGWRASFGNRAIQIQWPESGAAPTEAELRGAFSEYDAISHVGSRRRPRFSLSPRTVSRSRSRATRGRGRSRRSIRARHRALPKLTRRIQAP